MQSKEAPYSAIINSPIGLLGLTIHAEKLARVNFLDDQALVKPNSALAKEVAQQLQAYFIDPKFQFTLPLQVAGTPFQESVWRALQKIPAGSATSYSGLAKQLNTGARAVGNACRNNPIPIIIPCHRIVAQNGLGGFNGARIGLSLDIKTTLLTHEGYLARKPR